MQDIRVDDYGIGIMLPKADHYLVKLNAIPNISANILKQEMLSLGGDAAVARGALTGGVKKTDCLIMGTASQFGSLNHKLKNQPFGLSSLALRLHASLVNFRKESFSLDLGRYRLNLGLRTNIMGVINVTPDSFSGDGLLQVERSEFKGQSFILEYAQKLVRDGADIIDVGGESSRPGARPVPLKEELRRVVPVIKLLTKKIKVPVSVDTYKYQVAQQALDSGAVIVNDISGLRDSRMAKVISRRKAGVVLMHMRGNPRTMQKDTEYGVLMDEISAYLESGIRRALESGINSDRIIIDPGLGFGKSMDQNLEIINNLRDLKSLGRPILVGPSRKSFIGKILNKGPEERVFGTVAACVLASNNGAKIVRVHDVAAVKDALRVSDGISKT
jgi:dihydropteroate synthase